MFLLGVGLGCGPGLEEGLPRDAAALDRPAGDRGELGAVEQGGDRRASDSWTCQEHFANNYDHVAQGRATICGGHACAVGSGDDLGLYNTAVGTYLRETARGYFELGRCP